MSLLTILASAALFGAQVRADFVPTVLDTPQLLGVVSNPSLSRDSCGSARFDTRLLWTCRDTEAFSNGAAVLPVWSSSASWTGFDSSGDPLIGSWIDAFGDNTTGLYAYGDVVEEPFFAYPSDLCSGNSAGECSDGTRYALWTNSPPLVTSSDSSTGAITAYTWITEAHITSDLTDLNPDPPATLYEITYSQAENGYGQGLPNVTITKEGFWSSNQLPYGTYGGVVSDNIAYLYGQNAAGTVGLAKVPTNSVTDQSTYQYYVNGAWTNTVPGVNDTGVAITNAGAGGQGTFYYSSVWNLYVWIGQASLSIAPDFYITTAPSPEGPWAEPVNFYSAEDFGWSYSLQAHPGMLANLSQNAIYISWTISNGNYTQPLVYVEWES